MKHAIKVIALSSALISGLIAPAASQSVNSEVVFTSGDNNGALNVAHSAYGKSRNVETAIIDINKDSNPEVAVQFKDECGANGCLTTVLFRDKEGWIEVFHAPTGNLSISHGTDAPLASLITSDSINWVWLRNSYTPVLEGASWIKIDGSEEFLLSDYETDYLSSHIMRDVRKFSYDVNGDGAQDSILLSSSAFDCGGRNICPFIIFDSSGQVIADDYALEGLVGVKDGQLVVQALRSVEFYDYGNFGFKLMREVSTHSNIRR